MTIFFTSNSVSAFLWGFFTGHHPYGAEVHKYSQLRSGDSCKLTDPPTCTAINISTVEWGLHGNHTYYVTIKAENVAGLATYGVSEAYVHNIQLPAEGIVLDTEVSLENFCLNYNQNL